MNFSQWTRTLNFSGIGRRGAFGLVDLNATSNRGLRIVPLLNHQPLLMGDDKELVRACHLEGLNIKPLDHVR